MENTNKKLIDNAETANFGNSDTKKSHFLIQNSAVISGPIKKRKRPLRSW